MKTKTWLVLITLYLVWGSTYFSIKVAIETIPPFFHAAARFLAAGLILMIWQKMAGYALPTRKQWISTAIIGNLLLLGGNGLVSWAEQFIPSGIASLLIGSIPMFLVLGEALRPGGTKPNLQVVAGLLIGLAGILVLVGPSEISTGSDRLDPLGVIVVLTACIFWSIGSIYSKTADLPASSLMNTGAQMVTASVGLTITSLLSGELSNWNPALVSTRSLFGMGYLILFGSIIGFSSYTWLLKNAPLPIFSTYAYVNPVVALILGVLFADEPLNARIIFASAIILGSVIFINWARQAGEKKKKSIAQQVTKSEMIEVHVQRSILQEKYSVKKS